MWASDKGLSHSSNINMQILFTDLTYNCSSYPLPVYGTGREKLFKDQGFTLKTCMFVLYTTKVVHLAAILSSYILIRTQ